MQAFERSICIFSDDVDISEHLVRLVLQMSLNGWMLNPGGGLVTGESDATGIVVGLEGMNVDAAAG
eukprot:2455855-Amphidinium_carterae.6